MSALVTTHGAITTALLFSEEQRRLIKATVAKGASDNELELFLTLAGRYRLDPFRKEIWCIKRSPSDAALIMTSRDGYMKIAKEDPNYMGVQAFVVKEGDTFRINAAEGTVEHSFGTKRGAILGAWAMARHRRLPPVVCFVDHAEYKGNSPIWSKFPSAMIQKVAEVFVLKRQFDITGLVTSEEMDAEYAAPSAGSYVEQAPAVESPRAEVVAPAVVPDNLTQKQRQRMYAIKNQYGVTDEEMKLIIKDNFGLESSKLLDPEQYESLCDKLIPAFAIIGVMMPSEAQIEAEKVSQSIEYSDAEQAIIDADLDRL